MSTLPAVSLPIPIASLRVGTIDEAVSQLSTSLGANSSTSVLEPEIAEELKAWCELSKPAVARRDGDASDKFAELITICRRVPECATFFVEQLEINPSTLWRWSMGHSKPTSYVGANIVLDLLGIIQEKIDRQVSYASDQT